MANEQHLKFLKQGVTEWNRWRKENPELEPDLTGVSFSKAHLREVDLSQWT
jgi:hypothetical protein